MLAQGAEAGGASRIACTMTPRSLVLLQAWITRCKVSSRLVRLLGRLAGKPGAWVGWRIACRPKLLLGLLPPVLPPLVQYCIFSGITGEWQFGHVR